MTRLTAGNSKALYVFTWIAQLVVAAVYLQTMFFKLTYAPETQVIFGDLGGRPVATLAALGELTASLMLLAPAVWLSSKLGKGLRWLNAGGAVLSLLIIGGAIATHLFVIGVEVADDGGLLFGMALLVAALSSFVLFARRGELPVIGPRLTGPSPVAAA